MAATRDSYLVPLCNPPKASFAFVLNLCADQSAGPYAPMRLVKRS